MKINQALAVFLERLQKLDDKTKKEVEELSKEIVEVRDFKLIPGADGKAGVDGRHGIDGKDGRDGSDGLDGRDGLQGPRGEKGEKGDKGDKGDPGTNGLKGPKGDKGEKGNLGQAGQKGEDGKPGRIPRHKIQNGAIAFEIRPNQYGEWIKFEQKTQYFAGGGGKTWIDYATGFTTDPVFIETIAEGDVYSYNYGSKTLYRIIGNPDDAFYSNYSSGTFSGLVAEKAITI